MLSTTSRNQRIEDIYSFKGSESLELLESLDTIERIMPGAFQYDQTVISEIHRAIQDLLDSDETFVGCGTTRICFTDGPFRVVKIPYSPLGIRSSKLEIRNYENFTELPEIGFDPEFDFIPTAECYYLDFGLSTIKPLSMEWVTRTTLGEDLPRWVDWVDCGQVGYNSVGELVAFDL